MKKLSSVLEKNNFDEMKFHLEYIDVLIDFFESRKINVDELNEEKRILEEKIKEFSQ